MTNDLLLDMYVKSIVQSPQNLKMAFGISNALQEANKLIITSFLSRLKYELGKYFGEEWELVDDGLSIDPFKKWSNLGLYKKSWKEKRIITIQAERDYAKGFGIGIYRDNDQPLGGGKLKEELDNLVRKGNSDLHWDWYYNFNEYGDWLKEDVLLRMHEQSREALEWMLGEFIAIKKVAEPIMDQYLMS